jgi:peptidoglycan/LPS O-acetylase OafA/YrhL
MTVRPSPQHYSFIDALRGLAFLAVLIFHVGLHFDGLTARVRTLTDQGFEGVELFFVLSALTLFLSLDSRRRTERRSIVNFFIRRYFRIAPLFYAGGLFYYWFYYWRTGTLWTDGLTLPCIVSTLTFTNAWSLFWINRFVPGGWSIAVEMNFYLLVPLLYRKISSLGVALKAVLVALVAGALVSAIARWLLLRAWGPDMAELIRTFTFYWLPVHLPIFCIGFVAFHIIRRPLKDEAVPSEANRSTANLLLAFVCYLFVALCFSRMALYLGHMLYGVLFLLLIWSLSLHPNRWLVNPFTRYMGLVSFSAYITHFGVVDLVGDVWRHLPARVTQGTPLVLQAAVFLAAALAGTIVVSTVTYRLIELPGQAVGRWLIERVESSSRRSPGPGGERQAGRLQPSPTGRP